LIPGSPGRARAPDLRTSSIRLHVAYPSNTREARSLRWPQPGQDGVLQVTARFARSFARFVLTRFAFGKPGLRHEGIGMQSLFHPYSAAPWTKSSASRYKNGTQYCGSWRVPRAYPWVSFPIHVSSSLLCQDTENRDNGTAPCRRSVVAGGGGGGMIPNHRRRCWPFVSCFLSDASITSQRQLWAAESPVSRGPRAAY